MNIFTTLEQSKRLKEAGFPQGRSYKLFQYPIQSEEPPVSRPSAAEIMEEMKAQLGVEFKTQWCVRIWETHYSWSVENSDLLSALVEAYCKMRGVK
jgi:hypothetical protein